MHKLITHTSSNTYWISRYMHYICTITDKLIGDKQIQKVKSRRNESHNYGMLLLDSSFPKLPDAETSWNWRKTFDVRKSVNEWTNLEAILKILWPNFWFSILVKYTNDNVPYVITAMYNMHYLPENLGMILHDYIHVYYSIPKDTFFVVAANPCFKIILIRQTLALNENTPALQNASVRFSLLRIVWS